MALHLLFDLIACIAALLAGLWQKNSQHLPDNPNITTPYLVILMCGAVIGGYGFGTWNLVLMGKPALAHSILGALAGGIFAIELYKFLYGIRTATGAAYVMPFCVLATLGRIGCFLAGTDDMTYGTPSTLFWAVDFGDGIARHPVQLYEATAMAVSAFFWLRWIKEKPASYVRYAFPAIVGFYCTQRFFLEFLKPYTPIYGGLNLFQWLCLLLITYSGWQVYRRSSFVKPQPAP